jgi:type II secretory pathway pseudopilin PulG
VRTNNERGITLVELLAVLVLVSMVTTIIITTFSIAHRHNVTETKKLKLQQEANYIISAVLQKHRETKCYQLYEEEQTIIFKECKESDETGGSEIILGDRFNYELTHENIEIRPKETDLVTTLTVTDRENTKLKVAVPTVFTRYKSKAMSNNN